ncbi:hypothetical protein [Allomeiothermus silvanus]|uniref:hypothetical protein n=1 Tax=Allomeiothermus silvanus TaxID=52022 RepID=UPI0023F3458E|nr:hypothetical protein [Allomeiothermus silvanus]
MNASIALMGLLLLGLLGLVLYAPKVGEHKRDAKVRALAKMSRHARRHNTVVRYHNGVPFVVTHQRRGLVYMLEGRNVSRERLVRALGHGGEAVVSKVEQEEAMTAPNPTHLTLLS